MGTTGAKTTEEGRTTDATSTHHQTAEKSFRVVLLVFALPMPQADQREAGKTGLPLVALAH